MPLRHGPELGLCNQPGPGTSKPHLWLRLQRPRLQVRTPNRKTIGRAGPRPATQLRPSQVHTTQPLSNKVPPASTFTWSSLLHPANSIIPPPRPNRTQTLVKIESPQ